MKQISLFAEENRFEKLSELGDCLERLKIIDWESFRPTIALALIRDRKSNAGIPPYDCICCSKPLYCNEQDEAAYADSAYVGKKMPKHVRNEVCEKGYRNKPLTEEQKKNNRRKSKIRCRIEHVFAYMTMSMHGLTVRSIGIERAAFNIGLTNLVYNLCRYSLLSRKEAVTG